MSLPRARRTGALVSGLVAGVVVLAGCADESTAGSPGTGSSVTGAAGPATQRNAADVSFARGMVVHHAQAIEMSDIVLAKPDVDATVLTLARRIKAAQGPEISQLSTWLTSWGEKVPDTSPGMDHSAHGGGAGDSGPGGGMISAKAMTALKNASGPTAGAMFLDMMIKHHEGAITMAREETARGSNSAAKALAQKIIADQEREIAEMRQLLRQ
jgi:uncharacterized protein (DUF305 family)